jgi:hypothetical protein
VNVAALLGHRHRFGPGRRLSAEAGVSDADARVLAEAMERVRDRHPAVIGAVAYALGRGETIVRVLTVSGSAPALVRRADLADIDRVIRRILSALGA